MISSHKNLEHSLSIRGFGCILTNNKNNKKNSSFWKLNVFDMVTGIHV